MGDLRQWGSINAGEFDFGPDGQVENYAAARAALIAKIESMGVRLKGSVPTLTPEQSAEELKAVRSWVTKRFRELRR